MYRVPERLYRTADGRLVRHGHPDAAFLAFPAGMELSDEEASRFGVLGFALGEAMRHKPMDKMTGATTDKAGGAATAVPPGVPPVVGEPVEVEPVEPPRVPLDESVVDPETGQVTEVVAAPTANQPTPPSSVRQQQGRKRPTQRGYPR